MKDKISFIKIAKTVGERGKILVLSYMCLKDGKMMFKMLHRMLHRNLAKLMHPEPLSENRQ